MDDLIHYQPDSTPETLADNPQLARFDYTVRDDGKRTATSEYQNGVLARPVAWTYDDVGRTTVSTDAFTPTAHSRNFLPDS